MSKAGGGPSRSACRLIAPTRAELIERRWPQAFDQPSDLGQRRADLDRQLAQRRVRNCVITTGDLGRQLGAHADCRQRWAQPIVQVAANASALLLAGRHEPLPRADDVERQADRVHGRPGGAGQVMEEAHVTLREGFAACPRNEEQPANVLGAIGQRQGHRLWDGFAPHG
jgi:hypothetical protein